MTEFTLHRYEDVSDVSGTGDVAWGVEWPDGAVSIRWPGDHPSTATWNDIRDAEAIHGHGGKTVVQYSDAPRLVRAYQRVVPWLLNDGAIALPMIVAPHPDLPDRLRLVFPNQRNWAFWIALFDGSTDAAVHEDIGGESEHRWTSPDGDLWLVFHTRHVAPADNPLEIFDREDR